MLPLEAMTMTFKDLHYRVPIPKDSAPGQGPCPHGGGYPLAGAAAGNQWGLPPQGAHLPHGGHWSGQNHPPGCHGRQKTWCVIGLVWGASGFVEGSKSKHEAAFRLCATSVTQHHPLIACNRKY